MFFISPCFKAQPLSCPLLFAFVLQCMFRLCIWHILERGLGSKLEPLVGVGPTTAFKLEVWATARASDGDFGVARGRTIALPSTVHQLFGSPTIPDSHKQWSPGAISARVAREARAVGFTWTDLPPTSVEPSASDGALPSAAASAPEPVRRGRGKRGAATVAKPKPKRKSHKTGIQGRAGLEIRRGPVPLDPTKSLLDARDDLLRKEGKPIPDRHGAVPRVLSQGTKRCRSEDPSSRAPAHASGEGEGEAEAMGGPPDRITHASGADGPSTDKRIRLEGAEEASPLAAGDMPDPVPGPSAAAAPAPGVHFAVAGTVNQRLEAYFLCMKKLFGVDAAAGVTWLSRCAAIFPAFARHNSGDRVLTNNVLESYHRWLKHEYFT